MLPMGRRQSDSIFPTWFLSPQPVSKTIYSFLEGGIRLFDLDLELATGIAKALESRAGLDQWVGGGTGLMPWQASVFGPGPEEVLSLVRFLADEVMSLLKGATVPRGGGWEIPLPPSLQPSGGGITGSGGGGGGSSGGGGSVGGPSRIRVGYLSCSGFMGNTTTSNFVRTLFSDTDRARVSNVCFARGSPTYGGGADGSFSQTYIRENCEDYRDHTRMSVYETASEVSQIGVHVLVDLTGWTLFPCVEVLGLRSAPVQVTWHGYGGSLGEDKSPLDMKLFHPGCNSYPLD
jgi:hypothetical protein